MKDTEKDPIKLTSHRQSVEKLKQTTVYVDIIPHIPKRKGEGKEEIMAKSFHQTSKVYSEEIDILTIPVSIIDIELEFVIQTSQVQNFTGEFYRTFK